MKGMFIPEITVEMFRNGCLESIEALMAEGEVYDIEYDLKSVQPKRTDKRTETHACDCISRQSAINALLDELMEKPERYEDGLDRHDIEAALGTLPSAQPERKKGKWRRRLVDSGFNADWHCSECGWTTSLEEHGYSYCPNCGADMRGEKHDRSC